MKKLLSALALALAALFATASLALASDVYEDKVIVGDNFTLSSGQVIDGNLIVLGGNVTVEDGAEVTGNIVVFGGNVDLAGTVGQDLVTFGGNADLLETAVVEGRLATSGGSVSRAEGAQVKGGESQGLTFDTPRFFPRLPEPLRPFNPLITLVTNFAGNVVLAIGVMFLAFMVVLLLPDQTRRVSAALTTAPVASGLLGLLTFFAVPVLIALTAITICLIPVSLLGAMVYAMALIFGWIAVGALLGERMVAGLRLRNISPALSAALGTLMITFLFGILDTLSEVGIVWLSIPLACITFVAPLAIIFIGLGAVTLTRFGTRPFLGTAPAAPSAPPGDLPPPPYLAGDPPQPTA